jgi:hypothetical protein
MVLNQGRALLQGLPLLQALTEARAPPLVCWARLATITATTTTTSITIITRTLRCCLRTPTSALASYPRDCQEPLVLLHCSHSRRRRCIVTHWPWHLQQVYRVLMRCWLPCTVIVQSRHLLRP